MKRNDNCDNCNVVITSIHASSREDWYFDSGCSRHMTRNFAFFSEFKEGSFGYIIIGDGAKDKVLAEGKICKPNLLELQDVRLVKGLSANLISISQCLIRAFR